MKFHIITIFPESFTSHFATSMMKKALEKRLFSLELYKLGDFSDKNFKHVDDKAYGMHGQVICAEPLSKAIKHVFESI
jgi:tRNA (guanine37-N1)-methyltransferase